MNFKMLSILAVCSLSLLFACEQPDSPSAGDKNYSVSVSPESINVSSDASELTLTVTSDCSWNIAAEDKSWISLSRSGGISGETSITVKVSKNETGDVRESAIAIRYGSSKLSVPVRQNYAIVPVAVEDSAFKAYLLSVYDVDGDGVLSSKEAAAVDKVEASGLGIKSLNDIVSLFPSLTYLDCSDNDITELELSGLKSLKHLDCSGNALSSLDISLLINLEYFDARDNAGLAEINVWTGFKPTSNFLKPESAQWVEPEIPTPAGYTLVWQDEFNESSNGLPLTSKWWYETAEPGWVNNELQTYIAGRKGDIVTADVSDGTLKIRAIKDGNRVYSARINTTSNWTYGYFEARLKLPKGKGTWPAFWMMPSVWSGWPEGGEIDIMEHVGCVPTEVSSSIHCKSYYHAINTQKTAARKVPGVMDEFHTYALEWTETYIKTYVDGKVLFYYNPDDYPQGRTADTWPFNKPFELKLNLAWGGDWGGMLGIDESALPATYEIDYVRVFQKQ